jgi:hypothetical protein
MLAVMPYHTFDPDHILLDKFSKDIKGRYIASLSYNDSSVALNDIMFLTPPLAFVSYNSANNRLILSTQDPKVRSFGIKMAAIQESISQKVGNGAHGTLQDLYVPGTLTLYTFPSTSVQRPDGTLLPINDVKPGHHIRCVVKFYSIAQIEFHGSTYYRIQHSIPRMWLTTT